ASRNDRSTELDLFCRFSMRLILKLVSTACFVSSVASPASAQGLKPATPESQGVRSEGLREMSEWVRAEGHDIRSLIVLRNGKLILEWYAGDVDPKMNHNVFSITKSVVSTIAGKVLVEESSHHVDVTVGEVLDFDGEFENITLENLLTMRSGLPQSRANLSSGPARELFDRIAAAPDRLADIASLEPIHPVGNVFSYSNIEPQLVSAMIEQVSNDRIVDVATRVLFQPLGFKGAQWVSADQAGRLPGGYGLRLRPIDMAKLGQLFLQGGNWEGRQILPAKWVLDSVTDQTGSHYGYYWWTGIVGGKSFAAKGVRGQQLLVVPEKKLVFVVTADLPPQRVKEILSELNRNHLLASIDSAEALPENPIALEALKKEIDEAASYRPENRNGLPPLRLPQFPE
ncbi:MAG: serine hydrolase, partial [Verrucomicrobiota bacterium]